MDRQTCSPGATSNNAAPSVLRAHGAHNVEALHESVVAAGYDLEYHQLEAGPLYAFSTLVQYDDVLLRHEHVDRVVEAVGRYPRQCTSIVVPRGNGQFWCNGQTVAGDDVLLLAPGADTHLINANSDGLTSIHLPNLRFEDYCGASISPHSPTEQVPVQRSRLSRKDSAMLKTMLDECWARDDRLQSIAKPIEHLTSHLASALERSLHAGHPDEAPTRRWRALKLVFEYIEEHLGDNISMPDICRHANVSMSTLERLFRRELRTTPSRYIRSRRLCGVRQELLHSRNDENISSLATKHGLCHLGRFSKYFREHFGASPSELRRYRQELRQIN